MLYLGIKICLFKKGMSMNKQILVNIALFPFLYGFLYGSERVPLMVPPSGGNKEFKPQFFASLGLLCSGDGAKKLVDKQPSQKSAPRTIYACDTCCCCLVAKREQEKVKVTHFWCFLPFCEGVDE